jgi:hypothetical protein
MAYWQINCMVFTLHLFIIINSIELYLIILAAKVGLIENILSVSKNTMAPIKYSISRKIRKRIL